MIVTRAKELVSANLIYYLHIYLNCRPRRTHFEIIDHYQPTLDGIN